MAGWRKADAEIIKIARQLRAETKMTCGWIAGHLPMGYPATRRTVWARRNLVQKDEDLRDPRTLVESGQINAHICQWLTCGVF